MVLLGFASVTCLSPIQGEINDSDLIGETVMSGLDAPTAMTFLGLEDMLVIEKNTGKVQRILDGEILEEPLLDVNVERRIGKGITWNCCIEKFNCW